MLFPNCLCFGGWRLSPSASVSEIGLLFYYSEQHSMFPAPRSEVSKRLLHSFYSVSNSPAVNGDEEGI